jgi:hypothetical protein
MLDKLSLFAELIIDTLYQMSCGCSDCFIISSKKHNFDQFADVKVCRSIFNCFVSCLLIILF